MSEKINADQKTELVHASNLVPNKHKMNEFGEKANNLQKAVNEVRASFRPDTELSNLTFNL